MFIDSIDNPIKFSICLAEKASAYNIKYDRKHLLLDQQELSGLSSTFQISCPLQHTLRFIYLHNWSAANLYTNTLSY